MAVTRRADGYGPSKANKVLSDGGENTVFDVLAADLNGDNRPDLVHVRTDNGAVVFIPSLSSGGGGFSRQSVFHTGVSYNGGEQTMFGVVKAGLDGDLQRDLVHFRTDQGGKLVFIPYLFDSAGSPSPQPVYHPGTRYNEIGGTFSKIITADINADGKDDLIHVRTDDRGRLIFVAHLAKFDR